MLIIRCIIEFKLLLLASVPFFKGGGGVVGYSILYVQDFTVMQSKYCYVKFM